MLLGMLPWLLPPASPFDMATWRAQHYSLFTAAIRLGFFILSKAPGYLFTANPLIERRGRHLDELGPKDRAFIRFNQWVTVLLVFNLFHYCTESPNMRWQIGQVRHLRQPPPLPRAHLPCADACAFGAQLSLLNTCVAIPIFYIVYDFVYTLMHAALHHRKIYKYIHKHHHTQASV